MIDYKTIGSRIWQCRLSRNLSQEKLAELCDVGTTHISHIETGNCIPMVMAALCFGIFYSISFAGSKESSANSSSVSSFSLAIVRSASSDLSDIPIELLINTIVSMSFILH